MEFNQELKDQWVAALRSGEYKRTTGTLKRQEGDNTTYCCLGVLAEIMGVDNEFLPENDSYTFRFHDLPLQLGEETFTNTEEQRGGYLPYRVMCQSAQDSLAAANDNGSSFREIADLIESTPMEKLVPGAEDYREATGPDMKKYGQ